MAKFVYKMQNILNIKMRLETQAKTEFSQASARLDEEEDKLRSLILRRRTYEDELKNASNDKLDINKLKQYNNYIAVIKELMENRHCRSGLPRKILIKPEKNLINQCRKEKSMKNLEKRRLMNLRKNSRLKKRRRLTN